MSPTELQPVIVFLFMLERGENNMRFPRADLIFSFSFICPEDSSRDRRRARTPTSYTCTCRSVPRSLPPNHKGHKASKCHRARSGTCLLPKQSFRVLSPLTIHAHGVDLGRGWCTRTRIGKLMFFTEKVYGVPAWSVLIMYFM